MALATTVFCLALGYPLAYFVVRRTPGLRRLLYFLVVIPLWTNSLVLTYAWMVILRQDGATDGVARWLGLLDEAGSLNLLYTPFAVLIGLVYWHLPFMVYPIYAALERFDWSLLDAAQDLGATRWRAIGHILLPMSSPGILAGCLLVFIPALGNFVVPQLLGGAKSMFVGNLIQQRFLSQPQDWPLGAALGLLMMGVVTAALWAYFRFARRDVSVG
jgi:spermidine/putrescine transport system permease protein